MKVRFASAFFLCLCLACVGCGDSSPVHTVPVSGTVTYKGVPVAGATVSFWASGAPRAATGVTNADGEFKLSMFKLNDGAMPGENAVTVSKYESEPSVASPAGAMTTTDAMNDPTALAKMGEMQKIGGPGRDSGPKSLLPLKYSAGTSSPLKETVADPGPNSFVFQLTD